MEAGDVKLRRRFSGFPARYALAMMFFLGFAVSFALRVNLSVAIVEMKARRKGELARSSSSALIRIYRKNSAGIRRRAVSDIDSNSIHLSRFLR